MLSKCITFWYTCITIWYLKFLDKNKMKAEMKKIDWIEILGDAPDRSSTISFNVTGIHPHDLGTILDNDNVAVRVGHHCAQPAMTRFNVPATARISFGCYNIETDIDQCIRSLHNAREVFGF